MKLPTLKRITIEELGQKAKKDEPALVRAIELLNTYLEQVYDALNKGITVTDNMDGVLLDVELDGNYPYLIRWERKLPPKAVWIVYSDIASSGGAFCNWSFTSKGQLSINEVGGFTPTAASKIKIRLICLTG